MADDKADVKFTFGTDSFKRGFQRVGSMFDNFSKTVRRRGKQISDDTDGFMKKAQNNAVKTRDMTKQISKGAFSALTKFALLATGIVAGFRLIANRINKFVPEIGKVFSIASDIFFKNFLFPLRKFLLPLLNRFLQWVQKSRALFVQWGQILVTIIKGVLKVFKLLFNVVKQVFTFIFSSVFIFYYFYNFFNIKITNNIIYL